MLVVFCPSQGCILLNARAQWPDKWVLSSALHLQKLLPYILHLTKMPMYLSPYRDKSQVFLAF